MTTAMSPSTMMGKRGENIERRNKRKDDFRKTVTMLTTLSMRTMTTKTGTPLTMTGTHPWKWL